MKTRDQSATQPSPSEFVVIGHFRGLHRPFINPTYQHLSLLHGINTKPVELARKNHFATQETQRFKRPDREFVLNSLIPQDAVASLCERAFPSGAGLVVSPFTKDHLYDCLTPEKVGDIIVVTSDPSFYEIDLTKQDFVFAILPKGTADSNNQVIIRLNEAEKKIFFAIISPDVRYLVNKNVTQRKTKPSQHIKHEYFTCISNAYDVTKLLTSAFIENHGHKAAVNGYPKHIVEQVLLTFLWERYKHEPKLLKPYYMKLAKAGLIDLDLANEIDWDNLAYTSEDYYRYRYAKPSEIIADKRIPPLEFIMLLLEGNRLLANTLTTPDFGFSSILLDDGYKNYTDCGDNLLHCLFKLFLHRKTEIGIVFDADILVRLKKLPDYQDISEELIAHFRRFDTPAKAESREARYSFSNLVNRLNTPGNRPRDKSKHRPPANTRTKVRYLSPDAENGFYGIGPGWDNVVEIILILLGNPRELTTGDSPSKLSIIHLFNEILQIFSLESQDLRPWEFEVREYHHTGKPDLTEFYAPVPKEGWVNLSVVFREFIGEDYVADFDDNHFAFYEASVNANALQQPALRAKMSLFPAIKETLNIQYDKLDFIYEMPVNTDRQRIAFLAEALRVKKEYRSNAFQHLINQWLAPNSEHFNGWNKPKIVTKMISLLMEYMSTQEILDLNIPEFNIELTWQLLHEPKHRLSRVVDVKLIFAHDLANLQMRYRHPARVLTKALQICDFNIFNILFCMLNMNDYTHQILNKQWTIGSIPALGFAADLGNKHLPSIRKALHVHAIHVRRWAIANGHDVKYEIDEDRIPGLDSVANSRLTPLHSAITRFSQTAVEGLLLTGADVNLQTTRGKTHLSIAANLLEATLRNHGHTEHTYQKLHGVAYNKKFNKVVAIFICLLLHGANFTAIYRDNKTYLDWIKELIGERALSKYRDISTDLVVSGKNYLESSSTGQVISFSRKLYDIYFIMLSIRAMQKSGITTVPKYYFLPLPLSMADKVALPYLLSIHDKQRLINMIDKSTNIQCAKQFALSLAFHHGAIGLIHWLRISLRELQADRNCESPAVFGEILILAEKLARKYPTCLNNEQVEELAKIRAQLTTLTPIPVSSQKIVLLPMKQRYINFTLFKVLSVTTNLRELPIPGNKNISQYKN